MSTFYMKCCICILFFLFLVLYTAIGQQNIPEERLNEGFSGEIADTIIRGEENLVMVRDSQENISPTGNEYSFSSKELLVYPIKTSSVINVILTTSLKKVYSGEIRDNDNKIVKSVPLDALNNEIDLKSLVNGRYTLRITSENIVITEINIVKEPSATP